MLKKTIIDSTLVANKSIFFKSVHLFSQSPQAKFFFGLKPDKKIDSLVTVISPSNPSASMNEKKYNYKQRGKYTEQFVSLVNKHDKNITGKFKIIDAQYLGRYYWPNDWHKVDWSKENKPYLDKLNIDYEIIKWKDLLESEEFSEKLDFINDLYEKNHNFRKLVEERANEHAHLNGKQAALDYSKEEAAMVLVLNGCLTYPNKKLNPANNFLITKGYNPSLTFMGYRVQEYDSQLEEENDSNNKNCCHNDDYQCLINYFRWQVYDVKPTPEQGRILLNNINILMGQFQKSRVENAVNKQESGEELKYMPSIN
ncbi:MAG: hypothetical protein GY821_15230 [Gammaproteobacteria bacterium]|nr:hypothetical protein [Gammaproteobacteria bacterium]